MDQAADARAQIIKSFMLLVEPLLWHIKELQGDSSLHAPTEPEFVTARHETQTVTVEEEPPTARK